MTKSYFYEILSTQLHHNLTDVSVQFLLKLVEDCGQKHEENGRRVVYLPFTSKENVYQQFIDTDEKKLHASKSTFLNSWNKNFPDVYVNRDRIRNNVVKMLSDLAEECGDKQQRNPAGNPTGNPSGNSTGNSEGIVYLPFRSKKDVYDLVIAKGLEHLSYHGFCQIWERNIPHIRVKGYRDAVERFLSKLVQEVGKEDEHDNEIIVLPYGSKKDVYKTHEKDLHMTYKTFMEIWRNNFSHVKTKRGVKKNYETTYIAKFCNNYL